MREGAMRRRLVKTAVLLVAVGSALGGCSSFLPLDARIGVQGTDQGPIPFSVLFTSEGSTGPIVSRTWDFGDPASGANNASTAVAPAHTYTQHGAYVVTLTLFTADGRSSRATTAIVATNPPPVAALEATPDRGRAPLSVLFDLSHSVDPAGIVPTPAGTIVSYSLDFGDGTTPAVGQDLGIPVVHTYATPGLRVATLTVVDDDGAVGTASHGIAVEGVLLSLASPGPDPTGLAYDGASLWVSDATTNRIYEIRPTTGAILTSFDAPGEAAAASDAAEKGIVPVPTAGTPAGLAWQDGALWVACASDGKLYKVDPEVPTTDPGHILGVLESTEFTATGLAYGGGSLWVGDVARGRVFQVDPWTGAVLGSFAAPAPLSAESGARGIVAVAPIGMAWASGSLWITAGSTLVRVAPATGATLDSAVAPGLTPTGLAYDGRTLWVCDPNGANPGRIDRLVVP